MRDTTTNEVIQLTIEDQLKFEADGMTSGYNRFKSKQEKSFNMLTNKEKKKNFNSTATANTLMKVAIMPLANALLQQYEEVSAKIGSAGGGQGDYAIALSKFIEPDFFYSTSVDDLDYDELRQARLANCSKIMFICLSKAFGYVGNTRTRVAFEIYHAVFDEFEAQLLVDREPYVRASMKAVDEQSRSGSLSGGSGNKADMFNKIKQRLTKIGGDVSTALKKDDSTLTVKLGLELLDLVISNTGWFEIVTEQLETNKKRATLQLSDAVKQKHEEVVEALAGLSPQLRPTIIPPKKWTSVYSGGFYSDKLSKIKFIKLNADDTLRDIDMQTDPKTGGHMLQDVFDAINTLQDTAYVVNEFVLSVMKDLMEQGKAVGKLPSIKAKYVPEKLDRDKVSDEEFIKNRMAITKANRYNNSTQVISDIINAGRLVAIAEELTEYRDTGFHFVHTLDFRSRTYPVSPDFNPQGSDLHKSLLLFKESKLIDDDTCVWLAVQGANVWDNGLTKATFDERVQFIYDNEEAILACANTPLDTVEFWSKAEEPFLFLAFCKEWSDMKKAFSFGIKFPSRLPCAMDGTCNALQHWSALLLDEVTAPKVNMINTERPGDVYGAVAKAASEAVAKDCENSELDATQREMAMFFRSRVSRSLVKQNVMTKPYGSTLQGAQEQLLKKLKDDEEFMAMNAKQRRVKVTYLSSKVQAAIRVEVRAASEGMDFVQLVANHVCKVGVPLFWRTPDGFTVWQGYKQKEQIAIKTVLHGKGVCIGTSYSEKVDNEDVSDVDYMSALDRAKKSGAVTKHTKGARIETVVSRDTNRLDIGKNRLAVAPNLIHSLDATAMRVCVNTARDAGVTSIMTVHDSFATHAADYVTLAQATRQAFVAVHANDYLEDWFKQVTTLLTEEEMAVLERALEEKFGETKRPTKGKLNLSDVLESEYFFS